MTETQREQGTLRKEMKGRKENRSEAEDIFLRGTGRDCRQVQILRRARLEPDRPELTLAHLFLAEQPWASDLTGPRGSAERRATECWQSPTQTPGHSPNHGFPFSFPRSLGSNQREPNFSSLQKTLEELEE